MATFSVYLPPHGNLENPDENFRLVPDTKAPLALIFPPFWLFWHRLWLPLMVYFTAIGAILLLAFFYPGIAVSYLSILPGFYLFLEGFELVRKKLENDGWRYLQIVEGENLEEAEIRFIVESHHNISQSRKTKIQDNYRNRSGHAPTHSNMSLFPE